MMDERKLLLIALLFIAVVSVVGIATMMKSSSTAFAWGNVYENGNGYRNCYCHNGEYMVAQPRDPASGIYGKEVKFLGPRTQNECMYECQNLGYMTHYWTDPYAKSPTWPRSGWN
ncbi:hypothetical protein KY338_02560 [Candidatus Woesearchaeota archaeon]|nr:hypothetical protein [Candidatus Woesearchaeota archaeon]